MYLRKPKKTTRKTQNGSADEHDRVSNPATPVYQLSEKTHKDFKIYLIKLFLIDYNVSILIFLHI